MVSILRKPTLIRALLLTTGLAIIIVALFANRIGLSHSDTMSKGKILLFTAGIILFLFGLLTGKDDFQNSQNFSKRIGILYKGTAILLLNIIVLFTILEAGATLVRKAKTMDKNVWSSPFTNSAYYSSQDWTTDYWYEHSIVVGQTHGLQQALRYYPYTIWRRAPYNGKTINISQDGVRLTPGSKCEAGSYKVFAFGGSGMWGHGSPDWGTIPAYLQTGLGAMINKPVCTINFGEIGYVSTQELIELTQQLQAGNIPDLVIFYDGINDAESSYQYGRAGIHYDLERIAAKFEGRDANYQNPILNWMRSLDSFIMFSNIISRITPNQVGKKPKEETLISKGIDPDKLSDSVVQVYLTNYEVVDSLSHNYGFKYLFFWQPVISRGNKVLLDDEFVYKSSINLDRSTFYNLVYDKVESNIEIHKNLYNLQNIFDQQAGQIWIDWWHITPVGNQLVAQKMLDVIKPLIGNE